MIIAAERTRKISNALRHLADEIESMAAGSSRASMYNQIAKELRQEAENVDRLVSATS